MAGYEQEPSISPEPVELSSLMEVEFLRGSAWYKAFLIDYETDSQQAVITFGGHMNRDQQVPLKFLRYPPPPSSSPVILQEKGPVEALAPAAEGEPEGWWKGKIAKMKGEFYVVEFDSQGALFTDIFEGSKVRTPNSNQPFSETNFSIYRTAIEVPLDLHSFCSKDVHSSFSKSIGALSVSYRRDQNLLVFLAKSQAVIQRANLLSDMHMRNLRTKMNLEQRAIEVDRTNPSSGPAPSYMGVSREATFRVEPELLGLAIGRQGTNVTNARGLGGILRIDLDEETCTFHIIGESDQSIEEARKRLEFIDLTIDVPRKSIGRLIGKKGSLIQEIVDKSGVVKVKIEGDDTTQPRNQLSPDDQVPFHFIGRKENVETAQIMMDYQMAHIRDLDKFISEHDDIPSPSISTRPNRPADEQGGYRGGHAYGGTGNFRGSEREREDRYYSGQRRDRDREIRDPRETRDRDRDRDRERDPRSLRSDEKRDEEHQSTVRVIDRAVNRRGDRGGQRNFQGSGGYREQGGNGYRGDQGRNGDRRRQQGRSGEFGFDSGYDAERRRPFRENRDRDHPERRDRGDNEERRLAERSDRGRNDRRGARGGRKDGQRRYSGNRVGGNRAKREEDAQETGDTAEVNPTNEPGTEGGENYSNITADETTDQPAVPTTESAENGDDPPVDNESEQVDWSVVAEQEPDDVKPIKHSQTADIVNGADKITLSDDNTESAEP
ncbi:Fragile X mental retardation protein 1-like protein isoform X1 [Oopsacas minuta]|uniref:Fragile X mental retardation protein 1-like protein isoform X1 n=1 Tax=Oopsacas minuta TaxID=111878 RepID=A0AAV7JZ79_9METZ|nr:Fragile X mental retardation protein 1-like protein isoform X1 [Oopsacas minuta]